MKINDKVQRTDIFQELVNGVLVDKKDNFTIHDPERLKYHQDLHKAGYEYAVLTNGVWVKVPRIVIHQKAIPDECESCSS